MFDMEIEEVYSVNREMQKYCIVSARIQRQPYLPV